MRTQYPIRNTRPSPGLLLLIVSLLISPCFLSAQNLVVNSGFSNGMTGWATTCTTEWYSETTYGGTSSTNYVTEIDVERCINQQVCVMDNANYHFTYKGSRRTQSSTPASVGLTLKVTGVQTGTDYINVNHLYTNTTWAYTTHDFDFSIPAGSADKQVKISFANYNNTATYGILIDDISLILGGNTSDSLSIGSPDVAAINSPVNFTVVNGPSTGINYNWNFGTNATPGTSSVKDPTNIQWSTLGNKTVTVSIDNGTCTIATLTKTVSLNAAMPVKINSFSAADKKTSVQLQWAIANEQAQEGNFVVEKSNGQQFDSIGALPIAPGKTSYTFNDFNPLQGANTYRLRITGSKTGSFYSKVVTVNILTDAACFKVFPNPTLAQVSVRFNNTGERQGFIQLISLSGISQITRQLSLSNGTNQIQLDLSSLPAGTYIIRVNAGAERLAAGTLRKL